MGQGILTLNEVAAPTAPSAGKQNTYCDTADLRPKTMDSRGVISLLSENNRGNYLRNSGLWFAQRQAPGTLTTYSNTTGRAITADGWGVTNENASIQYIRTDTTGAFETGLQAKNYGTWSKITSTGKIVLSQVIAGDDTAPLRGRTVRFQCWMKASGAKVIKLAVVQNQAAGTVDALAATFISAFGANSTDPTLGTNLAYLAPKAGVTGDNCTNGVNAASCNVTAAWQRFGFVVDVPTTVKNVVVVVFTDSQFAAADSFSMSQASLTDGYEVQDWAPLPMALEIQKAQRFYCKSFTLDQNPIQNVGLNTGEVRHIAGKAGNVVNGSNIEIRFPVPMIKSPATTIFNPAAANAVARDVTAAVDAAASTMTGPTANDFYVTSTGNAGSAVGNLQAIHYVADAEL